MILPSRELCTRSIRYGLIIGRCSVRHAKNVPLLAVGSSYDYHFTPPSDCPLLNAHLQYLNIKLNDVQVVDEQKFPHLVCSLLVRLPESASDSAVSV
jgi:hypothetical protein